MIDKTKDKKPQLKKLSKPMERLVGALQNQAIWGNRRTNALKQIQEIQGIISETEANLNRLQGEIIATINGIIDNDSKLTEQKILQEAGEIVNANAKAKQPPKLNK